MPHVRNQTGASGTHYHYKKYVKCRLYTSIIFKKSLKIPKWWTETVNLWRTANTMVKRKRTKWNNNDLQNITHKTKDRATRKLGWTQVPQKGLQMNSGSPKGSADELMFPRRVCRTQFPRRVCRTQVPLKGLQYLHHIWQYTYLAFKPFDFERTWWRFIQKRVLRIFHWHTLHVYQILNVISTFLLNDTNIIWNENRVVPQNK